MKTVLAYSIGFIGFLLQGFAVVGVPIYVLFFGASVWWLFAVIPIGFLGMLPLTVMSRMLQDRARQRHTSHTASSPPKTPAVTSSKPQKEVDYFDKINSLLAAKGAREDFTTLQGWDKEFGVATTRVCALAELAQENPVVLAAFMLESMDHYHRNRDVALSYLARLESGFRARVEHPELAAAMDAEAQAKDESDELFRSIALHSNSPEATYIREVNDYIRAVGYYDTLVAPALNHEAFMKAVANVYLSGYRSNASIKVVGALIADGANKYKSDRALGILFLDKVATNMRKQQDDALRATVANRSTKSTADAATVLAANDRPNLDRKSEPRTIADEAAAYHAALDSVAGNALAFIVNTGLLDRPDQSDELRRLYAELLLYLSACKARNDVRKDIHPGTWNTFRRSVEVRMLSIREDGHQRSGVVRTAGGGKAFAQFTSTYWQRMDDLEALMIQRGAVGLIQHFLSEIGAESSRSEHFLEFFNELSDQAASAVVPKIAAMA